uniref:PH domain-containing protein n=1 Tax=Alexandrium monilatum TaxID=311494 RepID=A0A7S4W4P4_9DINO|mmetsp:Transcript_94346/g.281545  ORF Transcript_94346/g.281545 Transcript_94346/m.281545 type:complete len:558 (+) Transcript_94346:95-1768(+)
MIPYLFGGCCKCRGSHLDEFGTAQDQGDHVRSYSMADDQPMYGNPVRRGKLWYLVSEEFAEPVDCSLYANGISWSQGANKVSISLSPFCLVRGCKFPVVSRARSVLDNLKIFKLNLFTQDLCFFFGVPDGRKQPDAATVREEWVRDISKVVQVLTQSLFQPFAITCDPLHEVVTTLRRLMAGYLLIHESESTVSLLYCELHPHCSSSQDAHMAFYENERCQTLIMGMRITSETKCLEKLGVDCNCFNLDGVDFSTRTNAERKVWLRAISNVKVKLMNQAPSPSEKDLHTYRQAIQEYIYDVDADLQGSLGPARPLLARLPWRASCLLDPGGLRLRLHLGQPEESSTEVAEPAPAAVTGAPVTCDGSSSARESCGRRSAGVDLRLTPGVDGPDEADFGVPAWSCMDSPEFAACVPDRPDCGRDARRPKEEATRPADTPPAVAALADLSECCKEDMACVEEIDCVKNCQRFDLGYGAVEDQLSGPLQQFQFQQAAMELHHAQRALAEDHAHSVDVARKLDALVASQMHPEGKGAPGPQLEAPSETSGYAASSSSGPWQL